MGFTVEQVIEQLDYRQADDLVLAGDAVPTSRRQAWSEAEKRVGVDAAFFQGAAPLVYFRGLSVPSAGEVDEAVRAFHRRAWNHHRAPFLVVVLPDEIRVLDCLSAPFDAPELGRAHAGVIVREALAQFSRGSVMSGGLASMLTALPRRGVIEVLRADVASTRAALKERGLSPNVANDLLGRSLFVKYLEDRGVLTDLGTSDFTGVLDASVAATYELFSRVYYRFNGDVFPVTRAELQAVTLADLQLVADFLKGARNGQMPLWPAFDFSVIPAELLSNVYEEFLGDHLRSSASYYTPGYLVDLVLDELLPGTDGDRPATILDPACGSGMFIARAYRRLIDIEVARRDRPLSPTELGELLSRSIFGCEIVPSAARVAALSCYLVLLDYCTDGDIAAGVRFPVLLGRNVFEGDFFSLMTELPTREFDLVVSNPPWKSQLSEAASDYVRSTDRPVGDNQVAQAFFWACEGIVSNDGRVGLLMPSKSVLYARSRPNLAFRRAVLSETNLDLVIDFSAFRHTVFHDAVGPMAVFCLRPRAAPRRAHITFCTPHRSRLSASAGRVIISGDEIKRIPRAEAARRPDYWKTALSGTMRDVVLVEKLRLRYPTLRDLEDDRGWAVGSGFQTGGGEQHVSEFLRHSRFVPATSVEAFAITSPPSFRVEAEHFHRVRGDTLFRGPHVLVRRGINAHGFLRAAFLEDDAVFKNSVVGIAAPSSEAEELEIFAAIVNSSLARYYLYLTSSSWGVERPALEPADLRALPIALPDRGTELWGRMLRLARNADAHQATRTDLDRAVLDAYDLSVTDRWLVEDLVRVGISQHHHGLESEAFSEPSGETMKSYRRLLGERLSQAMGVTATVSMVEASSHYAAVSVGFGVPPRADALQELEGLIDRGPADQAGTVVLRRTVRIYRARGVDIAKPKELRFWTRAAAIQEVDDIVAECLRAGHIADNPVPA